jgi:hypothetical protein
MSINGFADALTIPAVCTDDDHPRQGVPQSISPAI